MCIAMTHPSVLYSSNMSRYNEGNTLSEGPKLIAITQAGVVLRYQGQEFLVTRE